MLNSVQNLSLEDSKSILHLKLHCRGLFNLCFGNHVLKAYVLELAF